ncbi:hypothetical protein NON00_02250 [Roseomonas sp. GC11]|uniref:hypothetical protein n=1 Tax=Roseomonas sp. GC11 TaxID=2950546 RepID=UPI00210949DA|nr:hypothetical protein [Roseomonas sp. GC11]MCQ4158748.1 hypothetical protein [Roseomonas sp. GC11]
MTRTATTIRPRRALHAQCLADAAAYRTALAAQWAQKKPRYGVRIALSLHSLPLATAKTARAFMPRLPG